MAVSDTNNPMATEIYNEQEKFRAILFLRISNEGRYWMLIQYLKESVRKGRYDCPTYVSGMYDLMVWQWGQSESGKIVGRKRQCRGDKPKVMFDHKRVQQYQEERDDLVPGTDEATRNVLCHKFNNYGPVAYKCPYPDRRQGRRGYGFEKIGVSLTHQFHEGVIYTNWILRDTLSTSSRFNNKQLIQDTKKYRREEVLHILKNWVS